MHSTPNAGSRTPRGGSPGQALVFAAFWLVVVVCFAAYATRIVETLATRVGLAQAADAAAYSAAVVQANALATIAAVNRVMIQCYRAILGIVVAVVTLGVLAALSPFVPGLAWAIKAFEKSLKIAREWIPRLVRWARRLSKAERAIARATPFLAEGEAIRIALANGATGALAVPLPRLGAVPEQNLERFRDRVSMGIPDWAVRRVFPDRAFDRGGPDLEITREHVVDLGPDRRGNPRRRTQRETRSAADISAAPISRAAQQDLTTFDRLLFGLSRERLPLPLTWSAAGARRPVVVAAWLSPGGVAARRIPAFGGGDLPAGYPGMFALAAARPEHPDLDPTRLGEEPENLYLVNGWRARLVPVPDDLGPLARRLPGLPRGMTEWIQH